MHPVVHLQEELILVKTLRYLTLTFSDHLKAYCFLVFVLSVFFFFLIHSMPMLLK